MSRTYIHTVTARRSRCSRQRGEQETRRVQPEERGTAPQLSLLIYELLRVRRHVVPKTSERELRAREVCENVSDTEESEDPPGEAVGGPEGDHGGGAQVRRSQVPGDDQGTNCTELHMTREIPMSCYGCLTPSPSTQQSIEQVSNAVKALDKDAQDKQQLGEAQQSSHRYAHFSRKRH